MERETSTGLGLGIVMAFAAAIIGIIAMTVIGGNKIRDQFFNSSSKTANEAEVGLLKDLNMQGETRMSLAETYSLIVNAESGVTKLKCNLKELHADGKEHEYDVIGDGTCLGSHLTGDCMVLVEKSPYGGYEVTINPVE